MGTELKQIGIFIPAWWPCSFFEEQQSIYASEYEIYTLFGTIDWLSKKRQIHQFLSSHSTNQISSHIDSHHLYLVAKCAKYNSEALWSRAISQQSERIGQLILSQTNGRLPCFVYIQSVSDIAIFIVEWAKRHRIKIVLAEHILYIRHEMNYISRRKEQLFSIADQVFCVSNYLYRNLLTSGFRMRDVRVIGNLLNEYAVPQEWDTLKKNGRIMFVAGHLADKDIPTLFAVAKRIQKGIDIFGLNGREKLEGKALYEYAPQNVTFKGAVPHNELLAKYSTYSILLSTSISETFGLSVAEAIEHGTPVVCTDSGGIREFVNHGNGCIVPIGDVDAIVSAITVCLDKNYDYAAMSKRIRDKYGKDAYAHYSKLII